jgi:hypothetical protein
MGTKTQKGSVTVTAVQWLGGTIAALITAEPWTARFGPHTSDSGYTLSILRTAGGSTCLSVRRTEWAVLEPDNATVTVMTNAEYNTLYA